MTVAELIKALQQLPQDLRVITPNGDDVTYVDFHEARVINVIETWRGVVAEEAGGEPAVALE